MGKTLTADQILLRAKTDRLSMIKNLNLWGNEFENVSVLREMSNVEVLSLSVNKITSLKDFAHCQKLTELYLRKNSIHDLREVNYLANLKYLRVLWLWDNPCSEHPLYRAFIIHTIPNLVKLDNTAISDEERDHASQQQFGDLVFPAPLKDQAAAPSNGYAQAPPAVEHRSARAPPPQSHHVQRPQPPAVAPHADPPPPRGYEMAAPKEAKRQGWPKRAAGPPANEGYQNVSPPPNAPAMAATSSQRNENILCAVLSLLKQLDAKGLELVRRDIDRKLGRE